MKHPLSILTALWLLAVLARFALFFEIRNAIGVFLDWAPGLFLLISGIALAGGWIVRFFRTRAKRPLPLLPAVGIVAVMVLLWGFHFGPRIGTATRLWRLEKEYLEIVAAVRANPDAPAVESAHPVMIDPGPPLRVAFSWGGLLDNWTGVIHDPSGDLAGPGHKPADGAGMLFGGTLVHVRHLWGPWYFCAFT